jgi:hypothetical protein
LCLLHNLLDLPKALNFGDTCNSSIIKWRAKVANFIPPPYEIILIVATPYVHR